MYIPGEMMGQYQQVGQPCPPAPPLIPRVSRHRSAKGVTEKQFSRGRSQTVIGSQYSKPDSLERQFSTGSLGRAHSRGALEGHSISKCTVHNASQATPPAHSEIRRQRSQDQLRGQESGSCSMHSPSIERSSSRGKIAMQPSQISNQSSRSTHVEKPSKHIDRDCFQHTKPKWQDSLRGSSSLSRNNSMEKGKRVEPSYYAVEARSRVSGQRFTNIESGLKSSANRRSRSISATKSARSKSNSPGRLQDSAELYKAVAVVRSSTLPRKNSISPMRSLLSESTGSKSITNGISNESLTDAKEDVGEYLTSYKSFKEFQASIRQSGRSNSALIQDVPVSLMSGQSYHTKNQAGEYVAKGKQEADYVKRNIIQLWQDRTESNSSSSSAYSSEHRDNQAYAFNVVGGEKNGGNCTSNDIGINFSRSFSAIGLLSTNINNSREFEVPQKMLHKDKIQSSGNISLRALKKPLK